MASSKNQTYTPMFDTTYGLSTTLPAETKFEDAIEKVKTAFKKQGFGLPPGTTNLDMAGIFKKKGMDFDCANYHVLGFCSPPHAFKVLKNEKSAGLLIPCNVVIARSTEEAPIEVAAVDTFAIFGILKNKDVLMTVVKEVRDGLKNALCALAE